MEDSPIGFGPIGFLHVMILCRVASVAWLDRRQSEAGAPTISSTAPLVAAASGLLSKVRDKNASGKGPSNGHILAATRGLNTNNVTTMATTTTTTAT